MSANATPPWPWRMLRQFISWAKRSPKEAPKLVRLALRVFLLFEFLAGATTVAIDFLRASRTSEVASFPVTQLPSLDVAHNNLQVYTLGTELYQDMLDAIRHAKRHVFFETFIWKNDEVGQLFKDALIDAAKRGVHVWIIYDEMGNLVVPRKFQQMPQISTLHVLHFRILRSFFLSLRNTGTDHRKILTVDNRVGFIGGYNIGSLYATQWRDTHLRIEGPGVWELTNAFVDFWNAHRRKHHPTLPHYPSPAWDTGVTIARNEPNRFLFPVRGLYISALNRAEKQVWITSAYFVPDKDILDELCVAAARGVDVRVLIPERSNHIAVDWVSRCYYLELLEAGVQIWLYRGAMIHAKTATVDGAWTTIGTANIDRLSMTGNYEVNLEVTSKRLAAQMEQVFLNDLSNSRQVTLQEWAERPFMPRLIERLLKPLGAVL